MAASTTEGGDLLKEFGRLVFGRFDQVLENLRSSLTSRDAPSDRAFREIISSIPEPDRSLRIAQYGLEDFVHELMAIIEDSDTFSLVGQQSDGSVVDLKQFSESGLQAEQIYWQEEFSKKESISQMIV